MVDTDKMYNRNMVDKDEMYNKSMVHIDKKYNEIWWIQIKYITKV